MYNSQNQNHVVFFSLPTVCKFFLMWSQSSHFLKILKFFLYVFHIKSSEIILLSTDTLCILLILFQPDFSVSKFPMTFWNLQKIYFLRNLIFQMSEILKHPVYSGLINVLVIVWKCWHNMSKEYMMACGDIKILLALGCTGWIAHIWWSHEWVLLSLFIIYIVPRMCLAAPCYEYNKTFLQHGLSCIYIRLCFRDISEHTVGFKMCYFPTSFSF